MKALECHPQRDNLQLVFDHEVNEIDFEGGKVVGVSGRKMDDGADYTARGEATIIASGGICGGDMSFLRENWFKDWGEPPKKMLNGAHQYGDGMLHKVAQQARGLAYTPGQALALRARCTQAGQPATRRRGKHDATAIGIVDGQHRPSGGTCSADGVCRHAMGRGADL